MVEANFLNSKNTKCINKKYNNFYKISCNIFFNATNYFKSLYWVWSCFLWRIFYQNIIWIIKDIEFSVLCSVGVDKLKTTQEKYIFSNSHLQVKYSTVKWLNFTNVSICGYCVNSRYPHNPMIIWKLCCHERLSVNDFWLTLKSVKEALNICTPQPISWLTRCWVHSDDGGSTNHTTVSAPRWQCFSH